MWRRRRSKVILDVEAGQTGLSTRKLVLESFGYNVLAAASGREALRLLEKHPIDAVLLDESADDVPLQKLTSIIKSSRGVPIVLVGDTLYVPEELRSNVDSAIVKLQDPQGAVNALDKVLELDVEPATGEAIDMPRD